MKSSEISQGVGTGDGAGVGTRSRNNFRMDNNRQGRRGLESVDKINGVVTGTV